MKQVAILGLQHTEEVFKIIDEYQEKLRIKAKLNWDLQSITEILKSERGVGLFEFFDPSNRVNNVDSVDIVNNVNGEFDKKEIRECLAFIIYRDLVETADIILLGTKFRNQSQGLMRLLLNFLKQSHSQIWLEVHELNTRAYQLYEKEGFKLDRVRLKYYTDGKSALVMSWKRDVAIY